MGSIQNGEHSSARCVQDRHTIASMHRVRMNRSSSDIYRQYAGILLVGVAYLGGIIGWTWAVLSLP